MPHVPTVDIRRLGDIRFDTQLERALRPSPDYDVSQWLFVPNQYTEYRYILGTRGQKPLICIGINPSTARPGDLDPTLKSVERVAKANGFDSCSTSMPSGPRRRTTWRGPATRSCTGRTCGPLPMPCP